ncbi:MAG: DUF424 domain-containing protein [Thermoprotei archaeon]|nr:MAG: DUF424 domain-containing protein [Thermoprotei archaeon]
MSGRYYLKVYRHSGRVVVAVCDEEILGKKFSDSKRGVVLDVSKDFYGGRLVDEKEVLDHIAVADIAVLTGRRIVELASRKGLAIKEVALEVEGQLHLQIIKEVQEEQW